MLALESRFPGRRLTGTTDSEYCCGSEDRVIHVDAADPSISLTKAQLRHQSKQIGRVLRDQYGVGAQGPSKDVVFNISTGNVLLPLLFYGTLVAEGVFSSTSPSATPQELAYQLRQTSPNVIICNADTKASAVAAAEMVGIPPSKVLVYQGEGRMELYEAVSGAKIPISNQELGWRRITDPEELANSVACLLYSSGTTGLPKAMKLSHQNLVAESTLLLEPLKEFNAEHRSKDFVYTNIAHLPVAHIAGVMSYFVTVLYMGGVVYWMPRFDFLKFCEYSKKYKANSMFTVPPIYLLISKMPNVTDQFDYWVDAISGAAPMGEDLQNAVSKKLCRGQTKVRQTWGLSETTGSFTMLPNDLDNEAPGATVGTILPHNYARVIDDDGNDVAPGQEGEIIVKGPIVIKGYWNNPQADAEAFRNGWFYTGDIGAFRDGWLYIVDRKKVGDPCRGREGGAPG